MPIATSPSESPRPSAAHKMEDRKRPAVSGSEELAPPSKRVAVNGTKTKDDSEEHWVENYAKGAIYREMQNYSRKATLAETRLEELHSRSIHHDDHLRIMDGWLEQVVDEIQLLVENKVTVKNPDETGPPYLSSVSFKDLHAFHRHLKDRKDSVITKSETFLSKLANSRGQIPPEAAELENQLSQLKAAEKDLWLKVDRLTSEKNQISEQLNTATLRYFKAEKKLDRAKSTQVQKLEQQALARDRGAPADSDGAVVKTDSAESNGAGPELRLKYDETNATATKQKEQIESLLSELKTIQEENSSLKAKRDALTDEDFAGSDACKQIQGYCEDLIKRLNNLEATNRQLRDDTEKLQAERSLWRTQLETEAQQTTQDLEAEVAAKDTDLARVRSARDEILAENTQRKATIEQENLALEEIKQLLAAKEDRINAFEHKLSRLEASEDKTMTDASDFDSLSSSEIKERYDKLALDFKAINQELPSIEKAYKKMKEIATKKVLDFSALEARVTVLTAEKSRADQKYFAARKDADTRISECRALRSQNTRSSELIAQLKEVETSTRTMLGNLEKQLADLRQTNTALVSENKKLESISNDASRKAESLSKNVGSLDALMKSKDSEVANYRERATSSEAETEKLKVRLEHMQKERDSWKKKVLSNSSEEEENLRTFSLCSVCRNNFKDTVLKVCGHLFCKKCIDDRLSNRMRKCPSCNKPFDRSDVMAVHH